jgi:hypothetical protein
MRESRAGRSFLVRVPSPADKARIERLADAAHVTVAEAFRRGVEAFLVEEIAERHGADRVDELLRAA